MECQIVYLSSFANRVTHVKKNPQYLEAGGHNYRMYGQVFCSKCSSFFIEIFEDGGARGCGGEHAYSNDDTNN